MRNKCLHPKIGTVFYLFGDENRSLIVMEKAKKKRRGGINKVGL